MACLYTSVCHAQACLGTGLTVCSVQGFTPTQRWQTPACISAQPCQASPRACLRLQPTLRPARGCQLWWTSSAAGQQLQLPNRGCSAPLETWPGCL